MSMRNEPCWPISWRNDTRGPAAGAVRRNGESLSEAKKKHRDAVSYTGYETTVIEELGDVLWYLTAVAHHGGLSLSELAHRVDQKPVAEPSNVLPI